MNILHTVRNSGENVLQKSKYTMKNAATALKKMHPSVALLVVFIGYNLLLPNAAMSDSHVEYSYDGKTAVAKEKEKKQIKKKKKAKKKAKKKNKKKVKKKNGRKINAPLLVDAKKKKKKNKNKELQENKQERADRIARLPQAEDIQPVVVETFTARTTYYASTPGQTSGNPFISASGQRVHWGMVATNCIPFGTKIRIPDVYGDQIFTVLDRHSTRYGCKNLVDVWTDYGSGQNPQTVSNTRIEIIKEI